MSTSFWGQTPLRIFITADPVAYAIYVFMLVMVACLAAVHCYLLKRAGGFAGRQKILDRKLKERLAKAEKEKADKAAAEMAASNSASTAPTPAAAAVRVSKSTDGRRRILVASRPFAIGDCIMIDRPLLVIDTIASTNDADIQTVFDDLTPESQDAVWTFDDTFSSAAAAATGGNTNGTSKTLMGILRSNLMPIGQTNRTNENTTNTASSTSTSNNVTPSDASPLLCRSDRGGLFPLASRAQHSCLPNAESSWCSLRKCMVMYPLRHIKEGEEITVSYLEHVFGMDYQERQTFIKNQYGFECLCTLCMVHGDMADSGASVRNEQRISSDTNRRRISILTQLLPTLRTDPNRAVATMTRLTELYALEGIDMSSDLSRHRLDLTKMLDGVAGFESHAFEAAQAALTGAIHHRGHESILAQEARARLDMAKANMAAAGINENQKEE